MIKPGDRVTLFSDMRKKATVVSLIREKSQSWYVGGTSDLKTARKIKPLIEFEILKELHGLKEKNTEMPFEELVKLRILK